jgi:hypothetical protein
VKPRFLAIALVLASAWSSRAALAGDVALAESLFRQGRELMEKGDVAAACPKLAESLAQDESTGTMLALALCQEKLGQTASAWANFSSVITRARRDNRPDRERAARQHAQALEPKLSRLTVSVESATAALPGLVVKRDGTALGSGAWGTAAAVDPGEHVVEVSAPGKQPWKTSMMVGAKADSQSVLVPALVDEPVAAAPTVAPAAEPARRSTPLTSGPAPADLLASSPSPLRTTGFVVAGVGLAGLGVSGFFALRAKSLDDESRKQGCDDKNVCSASGLAKRNDAIDASNVATIALIAGAVVTAAGVTLVIVGGPKAASDSAQLSATPAVGLGLSGVVVSGRF